MIIMEKKPIKVLFGTMTGNSEDLAEQTVEKLKEAGHDVELESLDGFETDKFSEMQRAIIVISTWGEGDPPDECEDFCFSLYDGKAPDLKHLDYCVLALGDSSYDDFCGCGRKVDDAVQKLGGQRFMDRKELDVDFDDDFDAWTLVLLDQLAS